MGYNSIISFAKAKKYVHMKKKEFASKDVYGILSNLVNRRKTQYLHELKYKTLSSYS